MKKVIAIIPARYAASRFPGKLLKPLKGKSIIQRTYEQVKSMNLFDEVIVACDHDLLEDEIKRIGGNVFRSTREHESGTDRIAEVAEKIEADIIINVQGDEPFIDKASLTKVIRLFDRPEVQIASLMTPLQDLQQKNNPNCVKVVTDAKGKALYFSRSPIPYVRGDEQNFYGFKHIGIYAFTKEALLHFITLPPSTLEMMEKLENLRMLENNMDIYLDVVSPVGISIDTPEDFERAEQYLESLSKADQ